MASARSAQVDAATKSAASLPGMRILLVENNDFNQQVGVELLANVAGAVVTVAINGLAALQALSMTSTMWS